MSPLTRIICVYGGPGVGKTTTATELSRLFHAGYINTGDIARRSDPESIAAGRMADREVIAEGFRNAMEQALDQGGPIIVDGLPRLPTDTELLLSIVPREDVFFLLLDAWPEVAIERQLYRQREGDTPEIIAARTKDQREIMELGDINGWAYQLADAMVLTGSRTRMQMINDSFQAVTRLGRQATA